MEKNDLILFSILWSCFMLELRHFLWGFTMSSAPDDSIVLVLLILGYAIYNIIRITLEIRNSKCWFSLLLGVTVCFLGEFERC